MSSYPYEQAPNGTESLSPAVVEAVKRDLRQLPYRSLSESVQLTITEGEAVETAEWAARSFGAAAYTHLCEDDAAFAGSLAGNPEHPTTAQAVATAVADKIQTAPQRPKPNNGEELGFQGVSDALMIIASLVKAVELDTANVPRKELPKQKAAAIMLSRMVVLDNRSDYEFLLASPDTMK